jgi:hypothetical protein
LLHTWSLAVEEQFYVFFPLLLAFLFRRNGKWVKAGLGILAISSFLFSIWAVAYYPSLAFYWPLTRAWELMCGAWLAIGAVPELKSPVSQNAASLLGFGLICFSAVRYTSATPFPGISALAPCLGTALVIAAGTNGKPLVNRMLSLRPVVFIGLISYSLYLWHWPVIVFHSMGLGFEGASVNAQKLLLGGVSILLGTLSWRFVERPFRSGNKGTSAAKIFRMAALCASVPTLAACVFLLGKGFESRFPPRAITVASYLANPQDFDRWHYRIGSCFITSGNSFADLDRATCLAPDGAKPNYLIFGDSHAAHLWYGLSTAFPEDRILQATASGCKPFLHHEKGDRKDCIEVMDMVLHDYLPHSHLKAIIIGGDWVDSDIPKIAETLAYIKGLGVEPILFGPAVQYDTPLPRLLAIAIKKSEPKSPEQHELATSRALDLKMAALAKNSWDVKYVSYFDALCNGTDCIEYAAPEVPLQGDVAHFTAPGSVFFAARLKAEHALD